MAKKGGVFFQQFCALFMKNWMVLLRHPFLNFFRCFFLPVALAIFLSYVRSFGLSTINGGLPEPVPVAALKDQMDPLLPLYWADRTNATTSPTPDQIMDHVMSGFSDKQRRAVKKVQSKADIFQSCPQNFNGVSGCFAALSFEALPIPNTVNSSTSLNYTIYHDSRFAFVNVFTHTSQLERRVLPLQWAVDSAIISLRTGIEPHVPMSWPFAPFVTTNTPELNRLSWVDDVFTIMSIALFVDFLFVAYHLPTAYAQERANLLTSHLQAMGLLDSARIISWHLSFTTAYLPSWIIAAVLWHFRSFSEISVWIVLLIHILLGLSLTSWSLFASAPFGKSPHLAAIGTCAIAVVANLVGMSIKNKNIDTTSAVLLTIFLPPSFYTFAMRAMTSYEINELHLDIVHTNSSYHVTLLPLIIAALVNIFLWPFLAVLLERLLYDAHGPEFMSWVRRFRIGRRTQIGRASDPPSSPNIAISLRNVRKTFKAPFWKFRKHDVTAIEDLSFDVPKFGIFVLLGSNGAGKSTSLDIIGNLLGHTSGSVVFEGGVERPPPGAIGIVPQKNVLFPELTCYQTLKVWSAVKAPYRSEWADDILQLLKDCDLEDKIHDISSNLSGGQKRKLQLAIGLVGGSKIVLVDEATSGVDPLSRRALWRTLTSVRNDRTILLTTHFLDEADLLADNIAILASPGKLVAEGSPVSLKSTLGKGYTLQLTSSHPMSAEPGDSRGTDDLLKQIKPFAPAAQLSPSSSSTSTFVGLGTGDPVAVEKVLSYIESMKISFGITSYDVRAASLEDIFLALMKQHGEGSTMATDIEQEDDPMRLERVRPSRLVLPTGQVQSPFTQALTVFHKRILVARRSWIAPILTLAIPICGIGLTLPIFTFRGIVTCQKTNGPTFEDQLYLPDNPYHQFDFDNSTNLLLSPPNVTNVLGPSADPLLISNFQDNAAFVENLRHNFTNYTLGGLSVDKTSGASLFAWAAFGEGSNGPIMLNLASNVLYNTALNASTQVPSSHSIIRGTTIEFPGDDDPIFLPLVWLVFVGFVMAIYPAFFALYVSRERHSSVQAMQLSNGLSNPLGLWLGHTLFDMMFSVVIATVGVILCFARTEQFHYLGLLWLVMVLFGIAATLFSYCVASTTKTPTSAFAVTALYHIIIVILFVTSYYLTFTYASVSQTNRVLNICHYTLALLSPINSLVHALFVSLNVFSLLCDGSRSASPASAVSLEKFGGPILYLILYSFCLLALLVWFESGSLRPRKPASPRAQPKPGKFEMEDPDSYMDDIATEAEAVSISNDPLRVLGVSKCFTRGGRKAVDDVSFGVSADTILALVGPNGAGKTTTVNIIRGDTRPDQGDVVIQGHSVVSHPRDARLALGVCPQFTAIDAQLTVRQHLRHYGRLKGLRRGDELDGSIQALMDAMALSEFADRLANKLSGGNKRKLALAIALIGNPPVIIIDEFSTGIDAKVKRDIWSTLKSVAPGKAIVITTHSMEEASTLANKVGIIAGKMLAVASTEALMARYPLYEVHFSCRTREDVERAQLLMSRIPGSQMADDVATRFEVPVGQERSLAGLFKTLITHGDFAEYTVERVTLETIFLKVMRAKNAKVDDSGTHGNRWLWC